MQKKLPQIFLNWFQERGWKLRKHQLMMIEAFARRQNTLLIAPTGAGKTLSSFLPSLIDLHKNPRKGLHTLYISPLKTLANDIERNLLKPINEMRLNISVETRTGDTAQKTRTRHRKKPPHILITTPESMMLMLSYKEAREMFSNVSLVIVDEIHAFATNKRGDLASLTLARIQALAPGSIRFGLSATVSNPNEYVEWLSKDAKAIIAEKGILPEVQILQTERAIPFAGYITNYAVNDIYKEILKYKTTIIFVNTRAQAEVMFQELWNANVESLPIALHHGSLAKTERLKIEALMSEGKLRAIVATSALDLGIDWGEIELVLQVGAPKGVSRMVQRIGRSNHRLDAQSRAMLIPSNRFEAVECQAAIEAIKEGRLDGEGFSYGALDVAIQFIINCAISEAFEAENIYQQIKSAYPYRNITRDIFNQLLSFAENGGYSLQSYENFKKLHRTIDGKYEVTSPKVARQHRMNIGTIVESQKYKVKKLFGTRSRRGTIIGEVEEYFAMELIAGDSFIFGGQLLTFERMDQLIIEARAINGKDPKVPAFLGGNMPLTTFLAERLRAILAEPESWKKLPEDARQLLELQERFSALPPENKMLVETFQRRKFWYMVAYPFAGRKAHQTLGILLGRHMEKSGFSPLGFSATDYSIAMWGLQEIENPAELFTTKVIPDEYEDWLGDAHLLKRSFRKVAVVSGLVGRRFPGAEKTGKQVTFSTDLIFDVLQKYEPEHILLKVNRLEAEREILDMQRVKDILTKVENNIIHKKLKRASPLAIPVMMEIGKDTVKGRGMEIILESISISARAEGMIEEVIKEIMNENA